jgi:hypothetical protein
LRSGVSYCLIWVIHLDFFLFQSDHKRPRASELKRSVTTEIMEFSLTLEFLKACRFVLGDDSPTAIVGAIRADDQTDWNAIQNSHAKILGEGRAEQAGEFADIRNVLIEACAVGRLEKPICETL